MFRLFKKGQSSRVPKDTKRLGLKTSIAFGLTLSAAAALAPIQAHADGGPIVQTDEGPVQGFVTQRGIKEFLGIPYAAPPVSTNPTAAPCSPTNLRWCPPVKHAPWTTVLKATAYGPICAQTNLFGVFAGPVNYTAFI
jgi:para-nitrobenzyl esterase